MSGWVDVGVFVTVALLVAFIGVGVRAGWRRAGVNKQAADRRAARLVVMILTWLGIIAALAGADVLSQWDARPPRLIIVFAIVVAIVVVTGRTRAAAQLLAVAPPALLIAIQGFRALVELWLYGLHREGRAPIQMTFEGQNLDVIIGVSAPLVALLVAQRRVSSRAAVAWNILGLASLVNVARIAATSTPGPLQLDWPAAPFTEVATWPTIWIPTVLLPVAVFLHIASIRQLRVPTAISAPARSVGT